MRSRIVLLTLPISDLAGLISLQVGLLAKLGLWSLSVMNASLLAVASTLSSMPSLVAIFLFSVRMARVVSGSRSKFTPVEHSMILRNGKIQHRLLDEEYTFTITQRLPATAY